MKYGYFDDSAREYVITTPETPLPWINYLGTDSFFRLISNTGGGYCFYKDARLLRISRYRYNQVPLDCSGHYFYIKDQDSVWNPGWQPMKTKVDRYQCSHGLGYSRFSSAKNGLAADVVYFVPLNQACEIQKVKLTNETDHLKQIQLFSYVEWCLWDADDDAKNYQRNLNIGEVEIENKGQTLYHKTEYRERRNHFAFYHCSEPVDSFDTDRDALFGVYHGPDSPKSILNGKLTDSVCSGWYPVASHQLNLTLKPGESRTLSFLLGYVENEPEQKWESSGRINKEKAHALISQFSRGKLVDQAFTDLKTYWLDLLSRYQTITNHDKVNRMVNIWHQYQCMVTFNFSRSASYFETGIGRGMGFRDSCQDILGFVHLIPQRARERILDIASTQFEDGSAYHQYQPLTKRGNSDIGSGFNDDPLWLIAAVSAYIRETGDFAILDEQVPFDSQPDHTASLLEHLKRSFLYTATHTGPHGLPLIGRADWNDCLNLNCFSEHSGESFQTSGPSDGPVAESLFIAAMFIKYGREFAEICRRTGFETESEQAIDAVNKMYQSVLKHGWDGEWFLRAYDANANKVGSKNCEEGQIFIEPQGFFPFAGVGIEEGLAEKALDSVQKHLETPYGIVLHQPAFTRYYVELGEISSYPPGYKENAGIFCHNNPWISIAETCIGRGHRAFELYKKTCPAYLETISDLHRTEPYVYAQMIAGKDAPNFGEAKNSWLTGTAAWTFVNISQYILGIQPDWDGLLIDPCLPPDFGHFQVTRSFRGTTYTIDVIQTDQTEKGLSRILVDGQPCAGNLVKHDSNKREVHVKVMMGKKEN